MTEMLGWLMWKQYCATPRGGDVVGSISGLLPLVVFFEQIRETGPFEPQRDGLVGLCQRAVELADLEVDEADVVL